MTTRSFPWAYELTPAGGGPVAVNPAAATIPGPRVRRTQTVTPMGSALYLPPTKAMADRTLPPEYWNAGQPGLV